jgi:hypothetical protein
MMKNDGWPSFSFTEMLKPPDGWRTDCALLSTYSADLVVVITSLLALTGCDLDNRRGSRVEVVKAVEALRGKVCVLAQAGRVILPATSRPILKLLDRFVKTVDSDENITSWHPKAALVRYVYAEDASERQWRIWLGSRNLTRALNWDAGVVLASRSDGKGRAIEGLAAVAEGLANRAKLPLLRSNELRTEFAKLTWECPAGGEVHRVNWLRPGQSTDFPAAPADTGRMFVISPFLDAPIVREASKWGGAKTHRTIVSTAAELQRLLHEDKGVFDGFENLLIQPLPDLPAEGAGLRDEDDTAGSESADGEEPQPAGLHAKLLFAAKGARRQLWLGSANATQRGWKGSNFEIVAELTISRSVADAIEDFVANCEQFKPAASPPEVDEDEEALESARKALSGKWPLRQRVSDTECEIIAREPPPLGGQGIDLEVAVLGGSWKIWPSKEDRILFAAVQRWQRSDFIQLRVSINERTCAWLQLAPCEPPPDEERDHALIAQYLDPRTFLLWLRSMLTDEPACVGGGDWDGENPPSASNPSNSPSFSEAGIGPSVEEILRSWSRDPSSFAAADDKVKAYLGELERRADERGATSDAELLKAFRQTWDTLASELR